MVFREYLESQNLNKKIKEILNKVELPSISPDIDALEIKRYFIDILDKGDFYEIKFGYNSEFSDYTETSLKAARIIEETFKTKCIPIQDSKYQFVFKVIKKS